MEMKFYAVAMLILLIGFNIPFWVVAEEPQIVQLNYPVESEPVKYGQKLFIAPKIDDCMIYYTLDGSTPNQNSIFYSGTGIDLYCEEPTIHIKAVAYQNGTASNVYDFGTYYRDNCDLVVSEPVVNNGDVCFEIINVGGNKDIIIATALYDGDNRLLDIDLEVPTVYRGENSFILRVDMTSAEKSKNFVWKASDMSPISYSVIYENTGGAPMPRRRESGILCTAATQETYANKVISGGSEATIGVIADYTADVLTLDFEVKDGTADSSDCINIYIDAGNEKLSYYDENDFKINVMRNGECSNTNIRASCSDTTDGWRCKVTIPKEVLKSVILKSGMVYGFDFGYTDYKVDEGLMSVKLWRGSSYNDCSTSAFGYLLLK